MYSSQAMYSVSREDVKEDIVKHFKTSKREVRKSLGGSFDVKDFEKSKQTGMIGLSKRLLLI